MKKLRTICLILITLLTLTACSGDKWQESYDLGMRYLSEGNYAEAIIAFDKAIKIDPKQPMAYVGRADAHIGSGETDDNLAEAFADYTTAIELDETNTNAWLGLADVYIRQGEFGKAREKLKEALVKTNNTDIIADKLVEIENMLGAPVEGTLDLSNLICWFEPDGQLTTLPNNEGAIGEMHFAFTVNAPSNTKEVRIAVFGATNFSEIEIKEWLDFYVEVWAPEYSKRYEEYYQNRKIPFEINGMAHPVYSDFLGETMKVLLIGLDENCEPTGYAIVTEQIPMQ